MSDLCNIQYLQLHKLPFELLLSAQFSQFLDGVTISLSDAVVAYLTVLNWMVAFALESLEVEYI